MNKIILAFVIWAVYVGLSFAGGLTLSWNPNTEADLAGYKTYCGTSSGNYGTPIDVGNVTTHSYTGLTEGVTYYCAVTAYDNETPSLESGFSNEVFKAIQVQATTVNIASDGTTLSWDVSSGSAASYILTRRTKSGGSGNGIDMDNDKSVTLSKFPTGTWFFVVDAFGPSGNFIAQSSELAVTIGAGAPTGDKVMDKLNQLEIKIDQLLSKP